MTASILTQAALEESHTAADYFAWVRSLIARVKLEPDGLERIRLRIGLTKQLMDEALPIGYLAEKFFEGSKDVQICLKIGNQNFDAEILDRRSISTAVQYIEITKAGEGEDDYLRMCVLHEQGEVSSIGQVTKGGTRKTGLTISVEREMVSQVDILRRERKSVSDALERKLGKTYPPNTLLLLAFNDEMAFNRDDNICNLETVLDEYLPRLQSFHSIAIVGAPQGLFLYRHITNAI